MFVILVDKLAAARQPEMAMVWATYSFICKALCLPNEEYAELDVVEMQRVMKGFYELFSKECGHLNCRPNLHLVSYKDNVHATIG